MRPALLTVAACAAAGLGWAAGGWLARLLGLAPLDWLAQAGGVLAALAALERAQARLARPPP